MENIINFLISNMEWIFIICLTISEIFVWVSIYVLANNLEKIHNNIISLVLDLKGEEVSSDLED